MNYASLKMERSEFEAYTSGDLVPPLNMMNSGCNQVNFACFVVLFLIFGNAGETEVLIMFAFFEVCIYRLLDLWRNLWLGYES